MLSDLGVEKDDSRLGDEETVELLLSAFTEKLFGLPVLFKPPEAASSFCSPTFRFFLGGSLLLSVVIFAEGSSEAKELHGIGLLFGEV